MADSFSPKQVEALAAALPPDGANPVGNGARAVLVNKMKGATPGHSSQLIGKRKAFKDIVFPNYVYDPEEAQIAQYTGLSEGFWADLAVAALCQAMHGITSRLRPQMLIDNINSALSASNSDLRRRLSRWYAHMAGVVPGDIRAALSAFQEEPSRAAARQHYCTGLTSVTWINNKVTQDASGYWTNREWELFHHWIKLAALGATDEEIDRVITEAAAKGLPVPDRLSAGDLGGDLGDATDPILVTNCYPYQGSYMAPCMEEDNSFEFTANGQPGNRYRRPPNGCCFAPGARVVMADGSLKAIETVGAGELVKTPDGARPVILRAEPPRGGRELYRIGDGAFAFTATHPFLIRDGRPETTGTYAVVSPEGLARALPTPSQFGIRPLDADHPPLLSRYVEGGTEPYRPEDVRADPSEKPDLLFDLFLDVGDDGRSECFVGDETTQLLVSSEVPRFLNAPATTAAILDTLEACAGPILSDLEEVPDDGFADLLSIGLDSIGRTLMPRVGKELNARIESGGTDGVDRDLGDAAVCDAVRGFAASSLSGRDWSGYNRRLGTLLDLFVARFGPQFQAAIRSGWRTFDLSDLKGGMVLAVTLYGLETFGNTEIPADDAALRVTLSRGPAEYARMVPVLPSASADRSFYATDQVVYFPEWRAIIEPPKEAASGTPWSLAVELQSKDGKVRAPLLGLLELPSEIVGGYQAFWVPVRDLDDHIGGQAILDVRTLTPDGLTNDLDAHARWSPESEAAVAHHLARLASEYIRESFRFAIEAFRKSAATPDGQAANM